MRALIMICSFLAFAGPVVAGEKTPLPSSIGALVGPDGQKWIVEGCAAYPVTSATKTHDKSAQMSKWIKPTKKASKPKRLK